MCCEVLDLFVLLDPEQTNAQVVQHCLLMLEIQLLDFPEHFDDRLSNPRPIDCSYQFIAILVCLANEVVCTFEDRIDVLLKHIGRGGTILVVH